MSNIVNKVKKGSVSGLGENEKYSRRPHQKEAIQAFHDSVNTGKNKMALIMATATGKTNVAIWCIEEYMKMFGHGKVLWIAHLDQIWQDADERFKELLPMKSRGFYYGDNKSNISAGVVIGGVDTLANGIKAGNLPFKPKHFDFIVIDEFHHAATETFKKVIDYFKPSVLLGMSCLKERHDKKVFLSYFGDNIIYEIDTVTAIERKAIAGLRYYAVNDDINYTIHQNGYEYTEMDQNRKLIIPGKDKRVIEKYLKIAPGKKTIAFCANIRHAERMAEYFNDMGIPSVAIHTKDAKQTIITKTEEFREGKYQVACTIDKWLEGADFPDVEVGLFLRPTKSWRVFLQARGRVLRLSKGKKFGIIIDAVANHKWINIYRQLLQEDLLIKGHRLDKTLSAAEMDISPKNWNRFVKTYEEISEEYSRRFPFKNGKSQGKDEVVFEPGEFTLEIEEVKDIFLRTGEERITKEHLIQDYLDLEVELGRQPTITEYIKKKHSSSSIRSYFCSWNGLLEVVGRECKELITREHLLKHYYDLETELGRQPLYEEYKNKTGHGNRVMDNLFGHPGWRNLVLKAGGHVHKKMSIRSLPREHFLQCYFAVKQELGRRPSYEEYRIRCYTNTALNKAFGCPGWNNLVILAGDVSVMRSQKLSGKPIKRRKGSRAGRNKLTRKQPAD